MAILNLCQVLVLQMVLPESGSFVPDGVLGGYGRGTGSGSEYSEGTADDLRWSCLIDHRSYLSTEFSPFPRDFTKYSYKFSLIRM
jgi:hypothetical protein